MARLTHPSTLKHTQAPQSIRVLQHTASAADAVQRSEKGEAVFGKHRTLRRCDPTSGIQCLTVPQSPSRPLPAVGTGGNRSLGPPAARCAWVWGGLHCTIVAESGIIVEFEADPSFEIRAFECFLSNLTQHIPQPVSCIRTRASVHAAAP